MDFEATVSLVVGGKATELARQHITIQPAESAILPFAFTVPVVAMETDAELRATVRAGNTEVPVESFAMQFFPVATVPRPPSGWVLLDPAGKTTAGLARIGWKLPVAQAAAALPQGTRVLVIGANALDTIAGCVALQDVAKHLENGLRVLVCEHSDQTFHRVFGLRAFTPGSRQSWLRDSAHPVLKGLRDVSFTDWRGKTSFGPIDGEPETMETNQRAKRTWRCSQEGVVASTIVEKPHANVVRPLLDTGFALRYTTLWEVPCGKGTILFCNLDISDRLGREPAADILFANLARYLNEANASVEASVAYVGGKMTEPDTSAFPQGTVNGSMGIQVLGRSCQSWLSSNGTKLAQFAKDGGTVVALGLTADEAKLLQNALGGFTVESKVNWLNPLEGPLPAAFRGLSIADIRWRKKMDLPVIASKMAGWTSPTGVLAELPVGKGRLVWVSAIPGDFEPRERQDLIFTRVQTIRLINLVLQNLGACRSTKPNYWAQRLASNSPANEADLYNDKRTARDDPYAEMRW